MLDNNLKSFTPFYYYDEKPGMQLVGYMEAKQARQLDLLPYDYATEE